MEKAEIRTIMKYEFLRGTSASETMRNINSVFGYNATTQQTVSNWFRKFVKGNFNLNNESRGRLGTQVDSY